jgi:hypothetical protein
LFVQPLLLSTNVRYSVSVTTAPAGAYLASLTTAPAGAYSASLTTAPAAAGVQTASLNKAPAAAYSAYLRTGSAGASFLKWLSLSFKQRNLSLKILSRDLFVFNVCTCTGIQPPYFYSVSGDVYPGSLIQGPKRHRIPDPDPQHGFYPNFNLCKCSQFFKKNECREPEWSLFTENKTKNLASLSLCHVSKCLIKYMKPMYKYVYVKILIYNVLEPI